MSRRQPEEKRSIKQDQYMTPLWCSVLLRDWLSLQRFGLGKVCDPFAGDGRLLKRNGGSDWGVEISPTDDTLCSVQRGDAFTMLEDIKRYSDTIITNPPYTRLQEALETFVPLVGLSCWMLRLNVLGGQKRSVWMRANMPAHVLVLPKRPSFDGNGTDATEYAWFVWRGSGRTRPAELEILPLPSME